LVDTGRTSSRGGGAPGALNVQQLPRDYDKPAHLHTRGCITPDPGWAFIVADYSQLELCSLAQVLNELVRFYARSKQRGFVEDLLQRDISETYESTLAAAINNDQDCHVRMASVLRGRGETYAECNALYETADRKKGKELLTAEERQVIDDRQLAKPANFGYPGGLGAAKFVDYAAGYGVTIDLATARRTKAAYLQAWIEMKLYFWHIGQITADGYATIKQLYSKRLRGDCYFTQAANSFFQALAADGAKEALRRIIRAAYRMPESPLYGTRPSGFIHDEFLVNCKIEQAEQALPALEYEMVEGMRLWIPNVKIKAPGKVLTERWGK
jgi:DNA polymerase-1